MVPLPSFFENTTWLHLLLHVSVDLVALEDLVGLVGIVWQLLKDKPQIIILVLGNV